MRGEGSSRDALEYLAEGDFCVAWLLDGERVVRVPRHDEAADALAREACLLPRIAPALPVPVPDPELVGPREDGDRLVSIHVRIPGVALTRERWLGLESASRARLARELGSVLAALHGLSPALAATCDLQRLDHRGDTETLRKRLRDGGAALPDALRGKLAGIFEEALEEERLWDFRPAILHADVSPGHVLVDPDREEITGVIDWGDAYLADQLSWTLDAADRGRAKDVRHGVAELTAALEVIPETRAPGRSP